MKKLFFISFVLAMFLSINSLTAQNLNGKVFVIQSTGPVAKGRVIDADGYTLGKNGTKIQVWDKNGIAHQNWKFVASDKGENLYYIICASPRAGEYKYLDASGADLGKNGGVVQLWKSNKNAAGKGIPNQLWKVTKNTDGTYRIASADPRANGACLDADGYTQNKNGGKVQMWQRLDNKNQAWNLLSNNKNKTSLNAGESLSVNGKLYSANGAYYLIMQNDGNLCVYKTQGNSFVWCSMAHGFAGGKVIMQDDGNLCVYDKNNGFKWGSYQVKNYPLTAGCKLILKDNGKLNILNASGKVVWAN